MQYEVLGRTGITVSRLCLGTMMFGAPWANADRSRCARMLDAALAAGVNVVDTADVYSMGGAEEILGDILASRRADVVLATKFHNLMGDDRNRRGNSRRWIMQAVEESLRRLRTDWIDIYQVHRPDPSCDMDETLGALSDLVHAGKIRAIGTSTFPADLIVEGQWTAERRGRERAVCEQPPYSILARAVESSVLPACRRHGLGVLTYSPLAGGWLSGKYRRDRPLPEGGRADLVPELFDYEQPVIRRKLETVEALIGVAAEAGLSLIELSLGFVLAHPDVTAVIVGPRTEGQLAEHLAAADTVLPGDVLDAIDSIVPPGQNTDPADAGWVPPSLADPLLRRRR